MINFKKSYIIYSLLFILSFISNVYLGHYNLITNVFTIISIIILFPGVLCIFNYFKINIKLYYIISIIIILITLAIIIVNYILGNYIIHQHKQSEWIIDENSGYAYIICQECGEVLNKKPINNLSITIPDTEKIKVDFNISNIEDNIKKITYNDIINDIEGGYSLKEIYERNKSYFYSEEYFESVDNKYDENKEYYIIDFLGVENTELGYVKISDTWNYILELYNNNPTEEIYKEIIDKYNTNPFDYFHDWFNIFEKR